MDAKVFIIIITLIYALGVYLLSDYYRKKDKEAQKNQNTPTDKKQNINTTATVINIIYDVNEDISHYKKDIADMYFSNVINIDTPKTQPTTANKISADYKQIKFTKLKKITV